MIVFLICMIPVSAFLGFMLCALCCAASEADRQAERAIVEGEQQKEASD